MLGRLYVYLEDILSKWVSIFVDVTIALQKSRIAVHDIQVLRIIVVNGSKGLELEDGAGIS